MECEMIMTGKTIAPAIKDLIKMLYGANIIASKDPTVTLCALDKNLFCGPGVVESKFSSDELKKMKDLGWSWSEENCAWGFYIGHG